MLAYQSGKLLKKATISILEIVQKGVVYVANIA